MPLEPTYLQVLEAIEYGPRVFRKSLERTSWTRFNIPKEHNSPEWPRGVWNAYTNPLDDFSGCMRVRLGREVGHDEHAVLIILWESEVDIDSFKEHPACAKLLKLLGLPVNEPSQFLTLEWFADTSMHPRQLNSDLLEGRVTLTTLTWPYDDSPRTRQDQRGDFFESFTWPMPSGDHPIRSFGKTAYTWSFVAAQDETAESATLFHFSRWKGTNSRPEWDDASARDHIEHQLWERAVDASPEKLSWTQQYWRIDVAPCYLDDENAFDTLLVPDMQPDRLLCDTRSDVGEEREEDKTDMTDKTDKTDKTGGARRRAASTDRATERATKKRRRVTFV